MPNEVTTCPVCQKQVDLLKPHLLYVNDIECIPINADDPQACHEKCYQLATGAGGVEVHGLLHEYDTTAHFVWPPTEAQYEAYRSFAALLQARIATLPPEEDEDERVHQDALESHAHIMKAAVEARRLKSQRDEVEEEDGPEPPLELEFGMLRSDFNDRMDDLEERVMRELAQATKREAGAGGSNFF